MDVYDFCRSFYCEIIKIANQRVNRENYNSDVNPKIHQLYCPIILSETIFVVKKERENIQTKEKVDTSDYISLWHKFCCPSKDEPILPVNERYAKYINDVAVWSQNTSTKIILMVIENKFEQEPFDAFNPNSRKRKAFYTSLNLMNMENNSKKQRNEYNDPFYTLIAAADAMNSPNNDENNQTLIDAFRKFDQNAYDNAVKLMKIDIENKIKLTHNALITYFDGPHIQRIRGIEEDNIHYNPNIIHHLKTSLTDEKARLEFREQNGYHKTFINKVKTQIAFLEKRLLEEQNRNAKFIHTTKYCETTPLFDKILNSALIRM